jgi:glyoxylase-like metal-dependent hydrolase (beta-lactamase superfamily II)
MPAQQLTSSFHRLVLGVWQAYLWRDDDGVTLIDTGAADAGSDLAAALDQVGLAPTDVNRVVLTHFHDDQSGGAAEVREWGDIEIIAHAADAPIIRGDVVGPLPNFTDAERVLHNRVAAGLAPAPPVEVDREVRDGDVLDFAGGAHVVAVPGHTDGSIALHLPQHGVLLTGDAVAEHLGKVVLGVFNLDTDLAATSMQRLAELDVEIAAFGHGEPVLHNAQARLRHAIDVRTG